ncbi:MAG: hypothetical protein JXQ90_10320 [Cyclobacteriaceae bacterium]
MENKSMSKDESLELISQMIGEAKRNFAKGGSFYFLLWGAVTAVCNFGHYTLIKIGFDQHYLIWLLTIPAAIITIVYITRGEREERVIRHLDRLHGKIWMGIAVCMIILIFFMQDLNYHIGPLVLLFTGIGTYASGQIIRYKPITLGGVTLWVGAVIAFQVPMVDQFLVSGITVLIGYVVPGLMLKRIER